jgi:hypothetical protein
VPTRVLLPVVVIVLGWFLVSLVSSVLRHRRFVDALRAEVALRHKLLDKLSSAEELRTYLEATSAHRLLSLLEPGPRESYRRIVRALAGGCVSLVIGLALFALLAFVRTVGGPWPGAPLHLFIGAVVGTTAGLALLVSAGLSYRLLKRWRLLEPEPNPTSQSS